MKLTAKFSNKFRYCFLLMSFSIAIAHMSYALNEYSLIRIEKPLCNTMQVSVYKYVIIPAPNNTWCYDIYKEKKLLIHQQSIPGLPGNEGFRTKTDAEKVARLVIQKLEKGQMPPSITKVELQDLKVLLTN